MDDKELEMLTVLSLAVEVKVVFVFFLEVRLGHTFWIFQSLDSVLTEVFNFNKVYLFFFYCGSCF